MHGQLKHVVVSLGAVLALTLAFQASAGSAQVSINITATVSNNCTISTSALAFGAYDPVVANLSTPLNGTGSVTTTCNYVTVPVITLGQGSNPNTGSTDAVPLRRMASGSDRLSYYLYQDSGHTTVWGNTSGTAPTSGAGNGAPQATTIYGQIPAGQNSATGSYSDTVVATVTF